MEPSYVIVSIPAPADGKVIDAFARVGIIWQSAFCLSSEGRLMPFTVFNSRETFWCFKQLQNQNVVLLYAGRPVAHLAGTRWQGEKLLWVTRFKVWPGARVPSGTQRWISQTECIWSSSLLKKNS